MRTTLGDKILIVAFLCLNAFLFPEMGFGAPGDWVTIEKGKTRIQHSPCTNKICIKSGDIQYADRLIACIPNRVVVRVIGKSQRGVDAIVG